MAALERCRSCHKPVRFLPTEKGKVMPVNPDPGGRSAGLVRTIDGEVTPTLAIRDGVVHVLRPADAWDGELYVPHFATCPEARRWTRKIARRAADRAHARVREGLEDERQGENDEQPGD
jgi:hypothetical protein